jgi:hypothetical protein
MLGDFFTKPLQGSKFRKFRQMILNTQPVHNSSKQSSPQECVTDRRFVSYADAVRGGSFTPNQHFKMSGDDVLGHLTYHSTSSQNKSKQQ